ncbi:MAG: hypothetical protein IJD59_00855 [Clostridia bacterium]|nr:hypothetical protein [Clostridia bacterium]
MKINGSCKYCGGKFEFWRCDEQRIYIRCAHCHVMYTYTFPDHNTFRRFADAENRDILNRLRLGLIDWETMPWDSFHKDLIDFINGHSYAENDMRFQMAIIACITRGFQIMDEDIYQRCTQRFRIAEDIYKGLMNMQIKTAKDPLISKDLEVYEQLRSNYNHLRAAYLAVKTTKKAVSILLKQVFKPLMPF